MKIQVQQYSSGSEDYAHLTPVVEYLIKEKGNVSCNDYVWENNITGYFCYLKCKIDFKALRDKFEFPDSISLDENKQTIDCQISYSVIRGSMENN